MKALLHLLVLYVIAFIAGVSVYAIATGELRGPVWAGVAAINVALSFVWAIRVGADR